MERRELSSGKQNTKETQTVGHMFMGKEGVVIITTNYTLVELVLNNQAVQQLTDWRTDTHQLTDTVMKSLARLDWNGEQILENTMTLVRLTLTRDVTPQLIREVADTLKTEHEHHKVQQLAGRLFDQHMAKLFGIDVNSLVFILEHGSVDDAVTAVTAKEKQQALQRILLSFLPEWVAQCAPEVSVDVYTLSPGDRAQYFGFDDPVTLSFLVGTWHLPERPSAPSAGGLVSPGSKTGGYIKKEADLGLPSTEAQELGGKQLSHEKSSQFTTEEKTQATAGTRTSMSTSGVSSQQVKEVSGTSSGQAEAVSESRAAASGDQPVLTSAKSGFAGRHGKADESLQHSGDVPRRAGRGDPDLPSEEEFFQRLKRFPNLFFKRCVDKASREKLKSSLDSIMDRHGRREQELAPDLEDEDDPQNLAIFLQWKVGDVPEAERKATQMVEEQPDSLLALSNQAYILWHKGQPQSAVEHLCTLETLKREDPTTYEKLEMKAHSEVVYLYIRLGHLFEPYAVSDLQEKLLLRRPHDGSMKFTLAETLRRYTSPGYSTKHLQVDFCPAMYRAIELLVEIKDDENNSRVLRARALAELGEILNWRPQEKLRVIGDQEQVRLRLSPAQCFEEAVRLAEDNPTVLVWAGKYFRPRNLDRSQQLLEKAVAIRPEPKTHHQLGLTLKKLALREKKKNYRPGLTLANGMITVLSREDRYVQETIRQFHLTLDRSDGDCFVALFDLGRMFFSLREYGQALDHFLKAAECTSGGMFDDIRVWQHIGLVLEEMTKNDGQHQDMSQLCFHLFLIIQCRLILQSQEVAAVNRETWFSFHSLTTALMQNRYDLTTSAELEEEGELLLNLKDLISSLPVLSDITRYNHVQAVDSETLETDLHRYIDRKRYHEALLFLYLLKLTSQSRLTSTWMEASLLRNTSVQLAGSRLIRCIGKNDVENKINTVAAQISFRIAFEESFSGAAVTESSAELQTSPSQRHISPEEDLPVVRYTNATSSDEAIEDELSELSEPELDDSVKEGMHVLLVYDPRGQEASDDVQALHTMMGDQYGLQTLLMAAHTQPDGRQTARKDEMVQAQLIIFVVETSDVSRDFLDLINQATETTVLTQEDTCSQADQSAESFSSSHVLALVMNSARLPSALQDHCSFSMTSAKLRESQEASRSVAGLRACCELFCGLVGIDTE